MTHDDILHEQILKKGQNKYSTLKKVSSPMFLALIFWSLNSDQSWLH